MAKKTRVAHEPVIAQPGSSGEQTTAAATPCGTVSKLSALGSASRRQAHAPSVVLPEQPVSLPRPRVPEEFGAKVPSNVRQTYLNRIIDECLKIYPSQQDAYDRVSV